MPQAGGYPALPATAAQAAGAQRGQGTAPVPKTGPVHKKAPKYAKSALDQVFLRCFRPYWRFRRTELTARWAWRRRAVTGDGSRCPTQPGARDAPGRRARQVDREQHPYQKRDRCIKRPPNTPKAPWIRYFYAVFALTGGFGARNSGQDGPGAGAGTVRYLAEGLEQPWQRRRGRLTRPATPPAGTRGRRPGANPPSPPAARRGGRAKGAGNCTLFTLAGA